jgi:mannose-6-phosphate isomerase-like protein (cupin superfamily)
LRTLRDRDSFLTMNPRAPLKAGMTFVSSQSGARLTICQVSSRGPLVVERELTSGCRPGGRHVHLDFAERFVIKQGVAEARIQDARLRLGRGEILYVDPTAPHVNPYPADGGRLVFEQTIDPSTPAAQAVMRTLGEVIREGRDEGGELPIVAMLAVLDETQARTYLEQRPIGYWCQRRLLRPAAAMIAKRRGFEVWLTR